MLRLSAICLLGLTCFANKLSFAPGGGPPWVSCFEDPPGDQLIGPKIVRTPTIRSADRRLRAYARIEARPDGQRCRNSVRLFVSSRPGAAFQQVFMQRASELGGNANSLRTVSWSPNGRWLLVQRGSWFYASDAGGLDLLLYDAAKRRVLVPNLQRMLHAALRQQCDMRVDALMRFDARSLVHLHLADYVDEGDEAPQTHCFRGLEEWVLDPEKGTMRPLAAIP